jgi:predicted DNA-binding transcriptional regulator AlpA
MQQIIKRGKLAQRLGVTSKTITKLVDNDGLPKPIKIGSLDAWLVEEIDAWVASKVVARDAQTGGDLCVI